MATPSRMASVTTLNRPGGNVTGVVLSPRDVGTNRLEAAARTGAEQATTIAVLVEPGDARNRGEGEGARQFSDNLDKAALSSGCKSHPATAPAGSNRSSHGGNEVAEAFG